MINLDEAKAQAREEIIRLFVECEGRDIPHILRMADAASAAATTDELRVVMAEMATALRAA